MALIGPIRSRMRARHWRYAPISSKHPATSHNLNLGSPPVGRDAATVAMRYQAACAAASVLASARSKSAG
jgi:hypothetical protein